MVEETKRLSHHTAQLILIWDTVLEDNGNIHI